MNEVNNNYPENQNPKEIDVGWLEEKVVEAQKELAEAQKKSQEDPSELNKAYVKLRELKYDLQKTNLDISKKEKWSEEIVNLEKKKEGLQFSIFDAQKAIASLANTYWSREKWNLEEWVTTTPGVEEWNSLGWNWTPSPQWWGRW